MPQIPAGPPGAPAAAAPKPIPTFMPAGAALEAFGGAVKSAAVAHIPVVGPVGAEFMGGGATATAGKIVHLIRHAEGYHTYHARLFPMRVMWSSWPVMFIIICTVRFTFSHYTFSDYTFSHYSLCFV